MPAGKNDDFSKDFGNDRHGNDVVVPFPSNSAGTGDVFSGGGEVPALDESPAPTEAAAAPHAAPAEVAPPEAPAPVVAAPKRPTKPSSSGRTLAIALLVAGVATGGLYYFVNVRGGGNSGYAGLQSQPPQQPQLATPNPYSQPQAQPVGSPLSPQAQEGTPNPAAVGAPGVTPPQAGAQIQAGAAPAPASTYPTLAQGSQSQAPSSSQVPEPQYAGALPQQAQSTPVPAAAPVQVPAQQATQQQAAPLPVAAAPLPAPAQLPVSGQGNIKPGVPLPAQPLAVAVPLSAAAPAMPVASTPQPLVYQQQSGPPPWVAELTQTLSAMNTTLGSMDGKLDTLVSTKNHDSGVSQADKNEIADLQHQLEKLRGQYNQLQKRAGKFEHLAPLPGWTLSGTSPQAAALVDQHGETHIVAVDSVIDGVKILSIDSDSRCIETDLGKFCAQQAKQ